MQKWIMHAVLAMMTRSTRPHLLHLVLPSLVVLSAGTSCPRKAISTNTCKTAMHQGRKGDWSAPSAHTPPISGTIWWGMSEHILDSGPSPAHHATRSLREKRILSFTKGSTWERNPTSVPLVAGSSGMHRTWRGIHSCTSMMGSLTHVATVGRLLGQRATLSSIS